MRPAPARGPAPAASDTPRNARPPHALRCVAGAALAVLVAVVLCGGAGFIGGWQGCERAWASEGSSMGASSGFLPVGLSEDNAAYATVARLAGADATLDNALVSFSGEAVGEPVASSSPGHKWVLVQQQTGGVTSSIQVLMSDEHVAGIQNFGSYGVKGSTLLVTGIYRVADPLQTGALDVIAYVVRQIDAGGPVEHGVDLAKLWVGLGCVAVGLVLTGVNVYVRRRSRS